MSQSKDPLAFLAEVGARAAEFIAHDRWPRAQIEQYQGERLRALLAHAAQASPYYREIMAGRSPADVSLAELPTLSRATLMAELDRIVTVPELRRRDIEAHIARAPGQPLQGRYHVSASSGTSGEPALIVHEQRELALWLGNVLRVFARAGITRDMRLATIGSRNPLHATRQMALILQQGKRDVPELDVLMPLPQLVCALEAYQPEALASYAGVLGLLAEEQLRGKLRIAPRVVLSTAEVLTPRTRDLIHAAWGVWPANAYSTTEAPCLASSDSSTSDMFLYEDLHVIEVVDEHLRPVPPGVPGARVLVTNLFSWTQPLIRYELGDALALSEHEASHPLPFRRVLSLDGRSDDILPMPARAGGEIAVHPSVLRASFADQRDVAQYQIVASGSGLELRLVLLPSAKPDTLSSARAALAARLEAAGALVPVITAVEVAALEREPGSGSKLKLVKQLTTLAPA